MRIRPKRRVFVGVPLMVWLMGLAPAQAQTNNSFRVGRYEGQVHNTTGNAFGKGQFDILSIAANGAVLAHFREYDGLEGEGDLKGAINAQGVMQLQGNMTSPSNGSVWQSAVIAVMLNGNIRLGNRLTLNGKLEEESATMAYAGASTPAPQPTQPTQPAQPAQPATSKDAIPPNVYLRIGDGLQVEAWYFGTNGRVWRGLHEGFTQAGLAAVAPRWRGTYRVNGNQLSVTADDGSTDQYAYELSRGRHILDKMFLSVVNPATNPQWLVGEYFYNGGNTGLQIARSLTLRTDGSYVRSSVGRYKADDGQGFGGSSDETGTWRYANHTLTFRAKDGSEKQQIALLAPQGSMVAALGYLFVGGTLYRRKE